MLDHLVAACEIYADQGGVVTQGLKNLVSTGASYVAGRPPDEEHAQGSVVQAEGVRHGHCPRISDAAAPDFQD